MDIYKGLLGLKFEKIELPTWDENVLEYQVKDSKSDEILGNIFLDLYHRPHKNTYPRVIGTLYRSKIGDKINLPAAAMI
jgi:Zn-dependent oligopeptidase